jgi:anti-sigma factor RsiW
MDPGRAEEHRSFEEMAVAHVLGGLDQDRSRLFRAHLLECSDCRARVGELRAIAHELADVERDERRERAAQTVETKRRDPADEDAAGPQAPSRLSRIVLVVGVGFLLTLAAWNFMLRSQLAALDQRLQDRVEASAALEMGEELPVTFTAAGITGTAKRADRGAVVLLEGVTARQVVGVYLLSGTGNDVRTVFSQPYEPENDKLLVLVPMSGHEQFLRVLVPAGGYTTRPDGRLLFEAKLTADD